MKGLSSTVIFVLVTIGLMVAAGMIIFWRWMGWHGEVVNEYSCRVKQQNYCMQLINGENPNWDEIAPKTGCEKFGVVKPTLDECKGKLR